MAAIVRFVASVGSTTARLDLSPGSTANGGMQIGGGPRLDDGIDFGRPKLTAVTADGALTDGDPYVASSYGNVRFSLPVVLPTQTSMDVRQSALRALAVELDRPTNVLYVQADTATAGRWLVTYRHADASNWLRLALIKAGTVDVALDRMPFAFGAATAVTIGAASGDPETGTWNFTLPAASGDVDAPMTLNAYVTAGPTGTPAQKFYVASKPRVWTDATGGLNYSRGTPDTTPTNVTLGVVVTGASGSGGTASRWTPGGSSEAYIWGGTIPDFLSPPSPAAARELVGRWRILARLRRSVAGDVFRLRARVRTGTTGSGTGPTLAPSLLTFGGSGGWTYVDLGTMQNPINALPESDPWGDIPQVMAQAVELYATRVSGSGTLDVDHMLALPADGRTVIGDMAGNSLTTTGDAFVVDGDRSLAYVVRDYSAARYIRSGLAPVDFDGMPLRVSPRWTTLVSVVPDAGDPGVTTSTLNLAGSYRPRYLDAL